MANGSLKEGFTFTQYSLATFESCPLKFKKRYIEDLRWNHAVNEGSRERLKAGQQFHLLAQRYFLGVDTPLDEYRIQTEELKGWMENLKNCFKRSHDYVFLPEYKLRMDFRESILEANFDLLILKEDAIEIWDWKTQRGHSANNQASRYKGLHKSLQTMVYLFVLMEQSHWLTGKAVECEKLSMHYWQPEPANILAEIRYDPQLHELFREELKKRIDRILNYNYDAFDKKVYQKHCRYCEFNWLCNRQKVDYLVLQELTGEEV